MLFKRCRNISVRLAEGKCKYYSSGSLNDYRDDKDDKIDVEEFEIAGMQAVNGINMHKTVNYIRGWVLVWLSERPLRRKKF